MQYGISCIAQCQPQQNDADIAPILQFFFVKIKHSNTSLNTFKDRFLEAIAYYEKALAIRTDLGHEFNLATTKVTILVNSRLKI